MSESRSVADRTVVRVESHSVLVEAVRFAEPTYEVTVPEVVGALPVVTVAREHLDVSEQTGETWVVNAEYVAAGLLAAVAAAADGDPHPLLDLTVSAMRQAT